MASIPTSETLRARIQQIGDNKDGLLLDVLELTLEKMKDLNTDQTLFPAMLIRLFEDAGLLTEEETEELLA